MNDLVSVILPTYNRAHLIRECIGSIICQSYKEIEIIIVDDGSTDHTEDLVLDIRDERIHYLKINHIGKIGMVRNVGMRKARGSLIAFIHSDDLWEKDKIQLQVEALSNHEKAGFSICEAMVSHEERIIKPYIYPQLHDLKTGRLSLFTSLISNRLVIYPSTIIFRRSCLESTGYINETLPQGDNPFFILLSFSFKGVFVVNQLVQIRKHGQNTTNQFQFNIISFEEIEQQMISYYERGHLMIQECNNYRVELLKRKAKYCLLNGKMKTAKKAVNELLKIKILMPKWILMSTVLACGINPYRFWNRTK